MKRRVPFALFLMGGLCVFPALATSAAPIRSAKPTPIHIWQPDQTLLNRLAAPVVVGGGGYELRPPLGYTLETRPGPGQSQGLAWVGPAHPDDTRPYLMLGILTMPAGEANKYSLKQILAKFLGGVQRRRSKNWQRTKAERGTLGGLPFVRASWSGTATGVPFKLHGFNYVAMVGNQIIQLSSQDVEPYHKDALALAQAAALTFKRSTRTRQPQPQSPGNVQILG